MGSSSRTIVIAVAGLVVAAALGYWGYGAFKKREAQTTTMAGVTDAAARLREALTIEAGPPPTDRTQTITRLEEHVAAVDQALQEIKRFDASSNQALVDATDDYLLTAREILKRQADTHRYRLQWTESWQALRKHMRRDTRTGAWVKDAVKARERANRDFRNYSLAVEVLGKFLESLAVSQKRIAPYVAADAMIAEDLIAAARQRLRENWKQAAAEMEKFKQPGALR